LSDKYYVGLDLTGLRKNSIQRPVSRVTLTVNSSTSYTAGDDSGLEITAECPYATQEMVDAIFAEINGGQYKMYSADDVNIDPAMELGDGVTIGDIYSVIARVDDDGSGYPSISAPGKTEFEDEYPYESQEKRKLKQLEAKVEEIEETIENLPGGGGIAGVTSFNTRTGDVMPEREDYIEFINEEIQKAIYESWGAAY